MGYEIFHKADTMVIHARAVSCIDFKMVACNNVFSRVVFSEVRICANI